ncbi:hypothetical protein [Thermogymnomonas acidicola]|uniref:hypothetical protein n=1 Tax=Thermogymnomonas acidicola TaxID=399579 RepID=UPI001396A0F5|nr:hypothetical protein [Thermogymnomonas acidicola]
MESHSTSNLAVDLGTVEYSYCHSIQRNLVSLRKEGGRVGNTILFCDHDPPVYTIGRKAERSNYSGVDVIEVERGRRRDVPLQRPDSGLLRLQRYA